MDPLPVTRTRFAYRSIVVLIILISAYYILLFAFISRSYAPSGYLSVFLRDSGITIAILVAEALVYWFCRKRLYERKWIVIHILLLYTALVFLPLIFVGLGFLVTTHQISGELFYALKLRYVRLSIFWLSIIIGHAFFIATIVKSISAKKYLTNHADTSPNILDDIS
ncbi:MAG: hypothetical protein WCF67_01535 [Chitinophagaceae bacterium]